MIRTFLLLIGMSISLCAQEAVTDSTVLQTSEQTTQTLLDEPIYHAIHGALLLKASTFGPAQKINLLVGGELAWVLNKKYLLGFGITGLSEKWRPNL